MANVQPTLEEWWKLRSDEERNTLLDSGVCERCWHLATLHSCGCCWKCGVGECDCLGLVET